MQVYDLSFFPGRYEWNVKFRTMQNSLISQFIENTSVSWGIKCNCYWISCVLKMKTLYKSDHPVKRWSYHTCITMSKAVLQCTIDITLPRYWQRRRPDGFSGTLLNISYDVYYWITLPGNAFFLMVSSGKILVPRWRKKLWMELRMLPDSYSFIFYTTVHPISHLQPYYLVCTVNMCQICQNLPVLRWQ